jgi:hypothetical protein
MSKGKKRTILMMLCCLIAASCLYETMFRSEMEAANESQPMKKDNHKVTIASEMSALSDGMGMIAENEYLQLFIDKKTTEVSVREKRNGQVWSTNPIDHANDSIATAINKTNLASQLIISYFNDKGHESFMNNEEESIKKNQFEITLVDNGVKITYEIGSSEKGLSSIPKAVGKERFEERILNKIADEAVRNKLRTRFFYNEEKQQYERKKMQDYVVKDVVAVLESIGYTAEDAQEDNQMVESGDQAENVAPRFTIPLIYQLEGENLIARIATDEVIDSDAFPLHTMQLLPFFGAANNETEGYMFVPDGSGVLIYLNNNNNAARAYEVPLYGIDQTPLQNSRTQVQYTQVSRFPVFGMKQENHAMFAIIEQGDAQATITADTSGKLNSYNRVGATFKMKDMEPVVFRTGSVTKQVPKYSEMYDSGLQIRYAFLEDSSADYTGMANYYRDYLIKHYGLTRHKSGSDTSFVLELIGSIPVRKNFVGIPYQSTEAVTTYSQAIEILESLQQRGISQIQLKYSGWFNKGVQHRLPSSIKLDSILGGKKKFEKLLNYAEENNIEVYPDVAFQRVYENGKGFKASKDATRFLNRKSTKSFDDDIVTTNPSDMLYYLLSPRKLTGVVDKFLKNYESFDSDGVSLRDLGEDLNSDVTSHETVNRQEAIGIIGENLQKIKEETGKIMLSGGNAYTLPYAKTIVNAPLTSSKFNIADEDVPFYSMVLHGYVDYAGKPINLGRDQDQRTALLKTLETGSNVFYQWFYAQPTIIRDTKLNSLYSPHYGDWFEEAVQLYNESNAILRDVQDQTIKGHRKLADEVFETTFEQGKKIIVNYNKSAVTVDDISIEAQGYRVIGGGL